MKFTFISAQGVTLPLSHGDNYRMTNFDSQTAARADISSITISGADGDVVNSARAEPRTISFDLSIIFDVERTKRKILQVIKLKQEATILWEQDEQWLEIKGVVEAIEMPRWTNHVTMQITMHCAQPYWENIDYIVTQLGVAKDAHYFTDNYFDMLYFPVDGIPLGEYDTTRTRTFSNSGDVSVGMEIEILAFDTVTNPIIYDQHGGFFGCGYGTGAKRVVMSAGDVIKINTRKNEKAVTLNGVSLLSKIKPKSTWVQLDTGVNTFTINSDDATLENMSFALKYKQRYI